MQAEDLDQTYRQQIHPLLEEACVSCHSGTKPKAGFSMVAYADHRTVPPAQWQLVQQMVADGEMPPAKSQRQLVDGEREALLGWLRAQRAASAAILADDPGPRPVRRLTLIEYDRCIQDLTGFDLRLTDAFPVDQVNQGGFSNDASVLTLSPAQLAKYQQAAERVAEHLAFLPSGLRFGGRPMTAPQAYDALCTSRIMGFYHHMRGRSDNLAGHIYAVCRRRQADTLGLSKKDLEAVELKENLAPTYLALLEEVLSGAGWVGNPRIAAIPGRVMAVDCSAPKEREARKICAEIADELRALSQAVGNAATSNREQPRVHASLRAAAAANSSGPELVHHETVGDAKSLTPAKPALHVFSAGYAARHALSGDGRESLGFGFRSNESEGVQIRISGCRLGIRRFDPAANALQQEEELLPLRTWLETADPAQAASLTWESDDTLILPANHWFALSAVALQKNMPTLRKSKKDAFSLSYTVTRADAKPALVVVVDHGQFHKETAWNLAHLLGRPIIANPLSLPLLRDLPAGLITVRRLVPAYWVRTGPQGDPLSMGLYHQSGYWRDDARLMECFLTPAERQHLDALWDDLWASTGAMERSLREWISFSRSEDSNSPLNKGEGLHFKPEAPDLVTPENLDRLEALFLAYDVFTDAEVSAYFQTMREGIAHAAKLTRAAEPRHVEDLLALAARAWRRPLSQQEAAGLCDGYRRLREEDKLDHRAAIADCLVEILVAPQFLLHIETDPIGRSGPVSDLDLASRLSFTLWASLPDAELLQVAGEERLGQPEVLAAQIRRLTADPRNVGFGTAFLGSWLKSNEMRQWNNVDRQFYAKDYDDALQDALYQEPIRFLSHLMSKGGSFFDLLYADYTVANHRLSRHYQIKNRSQHDGDWRPTPPKEGKRGGLLGMGAFLTLHAGGQRSSPVKRGHWLISKVLGEHIPPPPPDVPTLPASEADMGGLSQREILAKHREHPDCAGCHRRFDDYGVVFEAFDPIGRLREKDLAGHPIDTAATLPGGATVRMLAELQAHLRKDRHAEFVRHLARNLLMYCLGRELSAGDDPLLAETIAALETHEGAIAPVLVTVLSSTRYTHRRGRDFTATP